jgi:hypothetical protein
MGCGATRLHIDQELSSRKPDDGCGRCVRFAATKPRHRRTALGRKRRWVELASGHSTELRCRTAASEVGPSAAPRREELGLPQICWTKPLHPGPRFRIFSFRPDAGYVASPGDSRLKWPSTWLRPCGSSARTCGSVTSSIDVARDGRAYRRLRMPRDTRRTASSRGWRR